jgi:hypothetical protein
MQASRDSGTEPIEILPLVIVTQAFPARPSSLPDIRDFVRRRLTETPLPVDDIRTLCDRVADVLLDAAGADGRIQVSLRIFPTYAEVDVIISRPGDGTDYAEGIGAGPPVDNGPQREERLSPVPAGPVPVDGAAGTPAAIGSPSARPAPLSFADWLAAALRREGMTMEAAARELRVSAKTVSRWVSGTTEPRLRDMSRIREIFGELPFP